MVEMPMDSIVTIAGPQDPTTAIPSDWNHSRGKRMLDVLVAGLALMPCLPVMALVAVAVRGSSRGPILFRQSRVGKNGKVFQLMKFRTMWVRGKGSGLPLTQGGDSRVT